MAKDTLETILRDRFNKAIAGLSNPPVLIGPSWLRPHPSGKAGVFQFVAIPRIAKALKRNPAQVRAMLLQRLGLDNLGLASEVSTDMVLSIFPAKAERNENASRPGSDPPGRP